MRPPTARTPSIDCDLSRLSFTLGLESLGFTIDAEYELLVHTENYTLAMTEIYPVVQKLNLKLTVIFRGNGAINEWQLLKRYKDHTTAFWSPGVQ